MPSIGDAQVDISTTKTDVSITTIVDRERYWGRDAMDIKNVYSWDIQWVDQWYSPPCNHPDRIKDSSSSLVLVLRVSCI